MSWLISTSVRRPVSVVALCLLVILLAIISLFNLPVALLPSLNYPTILIRTDYPDAVPERVERALTEPVEQVLAGLPGLHRMESRSQLGSSLTQLDFGWNVNLDLALLQVREELDHLAERLPEESGRPIALPFDPSDRPILVLALSGATRPDDEVLEEDLAQIKQVARDVVARRLEQLEGVSRVRVTGGFERSIEIAVDAGRLDAYGLDLARVKNALERANVSLSGGSVRRGPYRYSVEVSGEFRDLAEIAEILVSDFDASPVRLRDVARVRNSVLDRRGQVRVDGHESILLLVERRYGANTVHTVAEVRESLRDLEKELPDLRYTVVIDESTFIEGGVRGLVWAILLGGLLAVSILLAALRSARSMIAVACAIPMSIALTLILLDIFDVSLNLISLSGLALGVGLILDNAIVVVENISRLREGGTPPQEAARKGAKEVAGAITASTLTTLAVFLPLTFVEGLAGRLFRDQSLAVACSLTSSLLVALTVVPAIIARERRMESDPRFETRGWLATYEKLLKHSLRKRHTIWIATLLVILVALLAAWRLPRELLPRVYEDQAIIALKAPSDADLPLLSDGVQQLEKAVLSWPEIRHILADMGERDEAWLDFSPRPPYAADVTVLSVAGPTDRPLLSQLLELPIPEGFEARIQPVRSQLESLLVPQTSDLLIDLRADSRQLAESAAPRFLEALATRPELVNVNAAHRERLPTYRLDFDRVAMSRFGVTPRDLATYLEAAASGLETTTLRMVNEEIPILVQLGTATSIEELLSRRLRVSSGGLMPMSAFLDARRIDSAAALVRQEQRPVIRLLADVAPSYDLGSAEAAAQSALAGVPAAGVQTMVLGANEVLRAGLRAMGWSFLLSLGLIYLILAAQFESLVQPVIILLAVPLALAGVVFALAVTQQSLNLMSLIGCVVLVGIVVNDAILKIDFINKHREAGLPLTEAIRQAGHDRIRPIVMTSLTTVLGLMPLTMGFGTGGSLRSPLATAIMGGLLSATVLTLFVVPVFYYLLHSRQGE